MSRPVSIEEMVRLFKSRHPTSHMLKIDNFSLLKKYDVQEVKSSVFDLGGHKWKLWVRPNFTYTTMVHMCLTSESPIYFVPEFELFVVSQLDPTLHFTKKCGSSPKTKLIGSYPLMTLADLEKKGYLIGDCCMFGVKFFGIEPAKPGTAECFSLIEKPLNNKVTWMMTNFSSLNPKRAHRSHEFVVGNRKWRIKVYPRGHCFGEDLYLSVYLCGVGVVNKAPKANTFMKYKLRVLDQVNRNHIEKKGMEWYFEEDVGFTDFMPLRKLHEPYLVNDKLYVGVEFEVISVTNYC